jgi:hypothetical protein
MEVVVARAAFRHSTYLEARLAATIYLFGVVS